MSALQNPPQQPEPYQWPLGNVWQTWSKSLIAAGTTKSCFIKMGMKLPSKKSNYFNTATVSFKWNTLIKQGEGAL